MRVPDVFYQGRVFSLPQKPVFTRLLIYRHNHFEIYSPRLCQNSVLGVNSNRGAKAPYPRARSPPPFLGSQHHDRKGNAATDNLPPCLCAVGGQPGQAEKYFCRDFAKIAF
jgi:hypothetical protein